MTKIVFTALLASIAIASCAINARAAVSDGTPVASPSYIETLRACGTKWKARDDRSVKGMTEWQTFRAECVKESGFKPKRPR